MKDGDDVISYIKSKQEWSQMRGLIQKLQPSNEEVNFNLYSNAVPGVPRYSLYICDSISNTQEMAFFIVQNGKEFDWLYSTKEGRRALAEACKQVVPGGYKRFHCYESTMVAFLLEDHFTGHRFEIEPNGFLHVIRKCLLRVLRVV